MDIMNYKDNRGLLSILTNEARIIVGYKRLLHVINLTQYDENILTIDNNLLNLQQIIKNEIVLTKLFNVKIKISIEKLNKVKETLNSLKPIYRNKRGLINGLGSIIKSITGNMDNDDYREISENIHRIYDNEGQIQTKINDQIDINEQMFQRLSEIRNTLTNSINILTNELRNEQNNTNNLISVAMMDQYIYQSSYNIEYLQAHLNDLSETIILAKIQVISHHILNQEEEKIIHEHFSKQNVFIHSENELYKLLQLQAYYNQSVLVFSIQIPDFHNLKFFKYILQPITINETYFLNIPNSNIIANNELYQYMDTPCIEIENTYYCQKAQLLSSMNYCVTQILYNLEATCSLINGTLKEEVTQLQPNYLYVNTRSPIEIKSTCNQKQKAVKGINLIIFYNCEITLLGITYHNQLAVINDQTLLVLPYNDISIHNISNQLDLPTLHNWTIQHQNHISNLQAMQTYHSVSHISNWSILILIFIILTVYTIYKYYHRRITKTPVNDQKASTFWPSLRGEELRHPDSRHLASIEPVVSSVAV